MRRFWMLGLRGSMISLPHEVLLWERNKNHRLSEYRYDGPLVAIFQCKNWNREGDNYTPSTWGGINGESFHVAL